jgi:hypothetical protein
LNAQQWGQIITHDMSLTAGVAQTREYFIVTFSHTLSINRPTKRGKEKSPSDEHYQCEKESINRPTKRGKEKSPSDEHYQCEKEMEDHLLPY